MIREAVEKDVPAIQSIAKSHKLFAYGTLIYAALTKWHYTFVMEIANQVVGYIIAFPLLAKNAFCLQVGIASEHQNKGLGTELVSFVEQHMKDVYKKHRLFAHTLRRKSLAYFKDKLGYQAWMELPGITILCKNLT